MRPSMQRFLKLKRESRLHFRKRLIEVSDQIFHVLDSHGEAHQSFGDSDPLANLHRHRSMRHRRRMRDERFHSSQAFRQRANFT